MKNSVWFCGSQFSKTLHQLVLGLSCCRKCRETSIICRSSNCSGICLVLPLYLFWPGFMFFVCSVIIPSPSALLHRNACSEPGLVPGSESMFTGPGFPRFNLVMCKVEASIVEEVMRKSGRC